MGQLPPCLGLDGLLSRACRGGRGLGGGWLEQGEDSRQGHGLRETGKIEKRARPVNRSVLDREWKKKNQVIHPRFTSLFGFALFL